MGCAFRTHLGQDALCLTCMAQQEAGGRTEPLCWLVIDIWSILLSSSQLFSFWGSLQRANIVKAVWTERLFSQVATKYLQHGEIDIRLYSVRTVAEVWVEATYWTFRFDVDVIPPQCSRRRLHSLLACSERAQPCLICSVSKASREVWSPLPQDSPQKLTRCSASACRWERGARSDGVCSGVAFQSTWAIPE